MKIVLDENGNVLGTHKHELNQENARKQQIAPPESGDAVPPVRLIKCSICNTTLLPERFEAHYEQCSKANRSQDLQTGGRKSTWGSPKTLYMKCKLCGAYLPDSQLISHLVDDHRNELPKASALYDVPLSFLQYRAGNRKLSFCPICQHAFTQMEMRKHLQTAHPEYPQRRPASRSHSTPPDKLVTCPVCSAKVRSDRLNGHIRKVHPDHQSRSTRSPHVNSQTLSNLVSCPFCSANVRSDRLEKHIHKAHPRAAARHSEAGEARTKQKHQGDTSPHTQHPDIPDTAMGHAFHDALEEARDGGKYLGYMTRENGRFGSLPLYDDYGDESDAD